MFNAMNETDAAASRLPDFTTAETKTTTLFILGAILQPPIFLFGFLANLINIIIYLRLGLKDSISICFFVLSCTDLVCVMILIVSDTTIMLADIFRSRWRVDGEDISWFIIYYYGSFYDISQGITTFIAVQKCWCVALPFRFKNTFTMKRTSVILIGICLAIFSIHVPIFASQDLVETLDIVNNRTLFKLWTSEIRGQAYSAVGLISLVFTTTCQMTVIFCLVVLASGLRASSKFRNSTSIANSDPTSSNNNRKLNSNQSRKLADDAISSKKQMTDIFDNTEISSALRPAKTTSRKELQALKSATFVSILFVVCNTFKLLNYYVILCIPEYSTFGRFVNTYLLTNEFRFTFEGLHISCNMLVYLRFNSRFRSTLFSIFRHSDLKPSTCA